MTTRPTSRIPVVEILLSTMNRTSIPTLWHADRVQDEDLPDVLIINQCTEIEPPAPVERAGVRMLSFAERGLALSRNRALDIARGDLLMLADDDLEYLPRSAEIVREAFDRLPDAAIVTFQFLDRDSGRSPRRYPTASTRHSSFSIARVASVEIAIRRSALGDLRFDTRFGLGTDFPAGEESILLADARRRGLGVYYWPAPIWSHPGRSSGYAAWDAQTAAAKGAVARRMYPVLWPAAVGLLALSKRAFYGGTLSPGRFVQQAVRGARRIGAMG